MFSRHRLTMYLFFESREEAEGEEEVVEQEEEKQELVELEECLIIIWRG